MSIFSKLEGWILGIVLAIFGLLFSEQFVDIAQKKNIDNSNLFLSYSSSSCDDRLKLVNLQK